MIRKSHSAVVFAIVSLVIKKKGGEEEETELLFTFTRTDEVFEIKFSSLSAPTKTEELTAGSVLDPGFDSRPAGLWCVFF